MREKSFKDLDTVAPTANNATLHLDKGSLKYANAGDLWQLGIVSIPLPSPFLIPTPIDPPSLI